MSICIYQECLSYMNIVYNQNDYHIILLYYSDPSRLISINEIKHPE